MSNFFDRNRNFLAIIIGAVIIGGCVYLSAQVLSNRNWADFGLNSDSLQNFASQNLGGQTAQSSTQNAKIDSATSATVCGAPNNTIVTKVIDGDTVVVEGGYHVRLLGMDADENGYPCYEPAKTRLDELVLSKQVVLEKDKTDLDQYGRCLRYIFIGNTNVDVQLVKEGLAIARFYEPDVKYRTEITEAEKRAQTSKIGCKWSNSLQ